MATQPTDVPVESFLEGVSSARREEAQTVIALMQAISGQKPRMWGPSIIGFGSQHYVYESGHEGDMPQLAFSPRKANLTVYFNKGFDTLYRNELSKLGTYKTSVACLYISKLDNIQLDVLRTMLEKSFAEQP